MIPTHRQAQSYPDVAGLGAEHRADVPALDAVAGTQAGQRMRLVVHLVEALDSAHVQSGLLNLIRHLPGDRYRHAIVCLRGQGEHEAGLREHGVDIINLHQQQAAGARGWWPNLCLSLRLYRVLRILQPDLIHTRDRAGLPAQLVAALAGVRLRVHAEHGREPAGAGRAGFRGKALRRLLRPLVDHFIAANGEVAQWLVESVGAEPARVTQIAGGVDSVQFHPRLGPAAAVGPPGFMHDGVFVIGSAGQMTDAASHVTLVDAFLRLIASPHPAHQRLRLLIVGDGPARVECQAMLNRAGAAARAWLPGARPDTPQLLRAMDLFVLPSLLEDRANAILEAMASGLPVVATAAGTNAELVHAGFTGILVPPMSAELLSAAISDYCRIPEMAARHGARARSQVIARHSMPAMARDYLTVYDTLTGADMPERPRAEPEQRA
jgi:sugar transferase (PEP-CTERM/EpsH1 system associated)